MSASRTIYNKTISLGVWFKTTGNYKLPIVPTDDDLYVYTWLTQGEIMICDLGPMNT